MPIGRVTSKIWRQLTKNKEKETYVEK